MIQRIFRKLKFLYLRTSLGSYEEFLRRQRNIHALDKHVQEEYRERLRPVYEHYVRDVSSPDMAASLELATFLYGLCKANSYTRLLDLGSGFSSYVFRLYARETSGVEVISVDDDAQWLKKTKDFLDAHDLDTRGMMTIEQFVSQNQDGFDCILHDLNFVEERIKYVQRLLPMVRPGGLMVLDDVHKPDYMLGTLEILSFAPGKIYSLSPATLDRYGRYSMAYIRPA